MVVQPRVSQIELLPASLAAVHPQKGSSSCGEPFLGLGSELIEGSPHHLHNQFRPNTRGLATVTTVVM